MSAAQRVKKPSSDPPRRSDLRTRIGVSSKVKVMVGGTKVAAAASMGLKYCVTENWLVSTVRPPRNSYVVGTTFKK